MKISAGRSASFFLMFRQDADAEMPRIPESLQTAQTEVQADEHEDGIQRNRCKRINRQAVGFTFFITRRHNGDSCREVAHDLSKLI
jgi:hypothetical protein